MKAGRGKSKGNKFEREICKLLSRWWTEGKQEDVFWRSASSGAIGTTRHKAGKKSHKHYYGDVMAVDPIGKPLTDIFNIELKRGYNQHTPYNLFDKPKKAKAPMWLQWFNQANDNWERSGAATWLIIAKRDGKIPICFMPESFLDTLLDFAIGFPLHPSISLRTLHHYVFGMTLRDFLLGLDRKKIERLSKRI